MDEATALREIRDTGRIRSLSSEYLVTRRCEALVAEGLVERNGFTVSGAVWRQAQQNLPSKISGVQVFAYKLTILGHFRLEDHEGKSGEPPIFPLRRVVSIALSENGVHRIETLECGHKTTRGLKDEANKRRRCIYCRYEASPR